MNDQITIITAALLQGRSVGLSQKMIEDTVNLAEAVAAEINRRFKEPCGNHKASV
jgi:hypothetical protein